MRPFELWAGAECSVVRVGDRYVDELVLTGHESRADDVDRLAGLGARALRFPLLWERTAPRGLADADWSWADERLARVRDLGLQPIVGLVHHGSGPRGTSLVEPGFVEGLTGFARAVAERYPWIRDFTPVNEPVTTARFSALYGHWYPHLRSADGFVRALVTQCAATSSAMCAIREVVPDARLVQTEDVGTVFSTRAMRYQADFENQRRFLSLDLLAGRVDWRHPMRRFLRDHGAAEDALESFVRTPCTPDVIGANYYVTSDRFLDECVERYPPHVRGGNGRQAYADVEAVRVRGAGIVGHRRILETLWGRYRRPLAFTEVHLGCSVEEQIRWLDEAWRGANEAARRGVDVRALTVWSAFGAYDWDTLLTQARGNYEAGAFNVSRDRVQPTALGDVVRAFAAHGEGRHPALAHPGWWHRSERYAYSPQSIDAARADEVLAA